VLPWLNSRHKREHHVPESEAELLVLDCWPRWRRCGEFARRVRWRSVAAARGRERARRGRRREAAQESEGERSGFSRCRQVRGSGRRPTATRGDVDGAWPPRGGRVLPWSGCGAARAEAGQTRAVGLGRGEVGRHWRGGSLGRLRPWAEKRSGGPRNKKSLFQIMFSRDFQTPVFKYHFEQENDIF